MPKHTGLLDHNADAQITKLFHRLHDGDWVHETIQDCTDIAEANKVRRNHVDPWNADKSLKHDACMPLIFLDIWDKRYGINFLTSDQDVQKYVSRLLEDGEWNWMKVDGKKNHNVSYSGIKVGKETPIFQAPKVDKTKVLGSDGTPMVAA